MSLSTFLITALPRSRTAWLAAFFSGNDSFCYHEGTRWHRSIKALVDHLESLPETYAGNSDSGLLLDLNGLKLVSGRIRIALIVRDVGEVRRGLRRAYNMELPGGAIDLFLDAIRLPFVECFHYDTLGTAEGVRKLWTYCMPGKEWDQRRYDMFARLRIDLDPLVHEEEMAWFGSQLHSR